MTVNSKIALEKADAAILMAQQIADGSPHHPSISIWSDLARGWAAVADIHATYESVLRPELEQRAEADVIPYAEWAGRKAEDVWKERFAQARAQMLADGALDDSIAEAVREDEEGDAAPPRQPDRSLIGYIEQVRGEDA